MFQYICKMKLLLVFTLCILLALLFFSVVALWRQQGLFHLFEIVLFSVVFLFLKTNDNGFGFVKKLVSFMKSQISLWLHKVSSWVAISALLMMGFTQKQRCWRLHLLSGFVLNLCKHCSINKRWRKTSAAPINKQPINKNS